MRKIPIGAKTVLANGIVGNVSEKEFGQQIVDVARLHGWMVYRTWNSIHSPAGFPDLVMVKEGSGRLLAWELKTLDGQPTPEQAFWLEDMEGAVVEARLMRPDDWDEILEELRR